MRRFELEPFLANVAKYEITEMVVVPPIAVAIIMSGLGKKYSLKSLKRVSCGAAPMGRETQDTFRQLFGKGTCMTQAWGMTEMSCVGMMFNHPEDDDTSSVGRLLPNLDAKIIDDDGNDITAYDTLGELCIRGPTVVAGYFENPKANAESFDSEGFFKTGDIFYCDEKSKKWYIVDRKKELIKVRGFQVAPPELESILLTHPHIVDAAVIGIKDPADRETEHPRAYVVKRPVPESKSLDEKTVKEYCGAKLARFKELTGGVRFVDAIPKNASGKILKRILREMAEKEAKEGNARL